MIHDNISRVSAQLKFLSENVILIHHQIQIDGIDKPKEVFFCSEDVVFDWLTKSNDLLSLEVQSEHNNFELRLNHNLIGTFTNFLDAINLVKEKVKQ